MEVKLIHKGITESELAHIARLSRGKMFDDTSSAQADEITVRNLVNRRHLSVLEFAQVVFLIQCPIFVARQMMRYRHCSYLERSLRYCEPIDTTDEYKRRLADGEPKESARKCLPLDTTTVYYCSTNLREMLTIFEQRLRPETQAETRELVRLMLDATREAYPTVIDAFGL